MPDIVDLAGSIEAETIAASLARAAEPLRPGSAGECEGCDWWMPRLVDGLCGFCRDGRPRPADWEPPVRPEQPRVASIAAPLPENAAMPHAPGTKSITIAASGAVLTEIQRRTAGGTTSSNRAALELIEAGIAAGDGKATAPIAQAVETRTPRQRLVALLDSLSDLVVEQIEVAANPQPDGDLVAERDAWRARAEAAETKVERIRAEALA